MERWRWAQCLWERKRSGGGRRENENDGEHGRKENENDREHVRGWPVQLPYVWWKLISPTQLGCRFFCFSLQALNELTPIVGKAVSHCHKLHICWDYWLRFIFSWVQSFSEIIQNVFFLNQFCNGFAFYKQFLCKITNIFEHLQGDIRPIFYCIWVC